MKKIIIFDFDGVLCDSVDAVYEMNKEVFRSFNIELTLEQYLSGFEEHINQRLATLFHLSDEEKTTMVEYKATLFPKYYQAPGVHLFPFAKELVAAASKLGELWIVSSSPSDLISAILEPYGLAASFTRIIGQNKQPKHIFFQEALADKKQGEVFFITDTTGDLKEMKKADIEACTLAVPWGFHTSTLLQTENPDVVVKEPQDIIDFIKSH